MIKASIIVANTFLSATGGISSSSPQIVDLAQHYQTSLQQLSSNIGGHFDYLTGKHFNNKAIQDLDKKFQSVLDKIGELENFDGPFSEEIKDLYNNEMNQISQKGGYFNVPAEDKNRQIDLCSSLKIKNFYENFYNKINKFFEDHPKYLLVIEPETVDSLNNIKDDITNLDRLNGIHKSFLESQLKNTQCFPIT